MEGNKRFELQQLQLYGNTTVVKYRKLIGDSRRLNYNNYNYIWKPGLHDHLPSAALH